MDGFVGPIRPAHAVPQANKTAHRNQKESQFHLDAEADAKRHKEAEQDPRKEEETTRGDLPVGNPRFDESGTRIDFTA